MKRWMPGLLLTLLLALYALPAYAAPSVDMKAEIAGGGRVRFGGWVTIMVDLNNRGGEVAAELVASNLEGPVWERSPEYVVPLTLTAGGKNRVPLSIPVFNGGRVNVRLRSGGTVVQEQSIDLMNISPDALLVGVLSDDELGIPALARVGGEDAGQVARLGRETFPTSAAMLAGYDVIALARFDTGLMSRDQMQALEAWVGRGGTLLLAGGPEWKRTFGAMPPALVPVSVTGTKDVDLAGLEQIAGKPFSGKAPVSVGQVLRGQVLAAAGETPLVVVDRVGTGKVVYLAGDPSLEPLAGAPGVADLLDRLLTVPARGGFENKSNEDNMMMSALQQMPGLGLPSAVLLGSLLGGYMLLVGPLSYWILKRKDRREWLWLTVPVLSLGFVGAVYSAGLGKQINLISHVITVTELSPGTQAATMTAYVGVYAPSRSQLDVDLGQARLVRPLMVFSGNENERSTRVVYGDKTSVELLGLNNYSMKGFAVEHDLAVKGGLELVDVAVDPNGNLTGTVANRLDRPVQGLQITAGGSWAEIGNLDPGQTSAPFSLDLSQINRMGKGGPMFISSGPGPGVNDQRREMVLSALFGWQREQVRPGAIMVAGWTDEPVAATGVPELGRMTQGTNLVFARAAIPADTARGEIPPGVVIGGHTSGPGFGRSPYGYSMSQGAHTFTMILPPVDPANVAEVKLHTQILGSTRGYSLAVKNQKSGQWVDLEAASVQTLKGWQDYVGAGGVMEILVDVAEHVEMAPPTVSVKGVAR